MRDLLGNIKKTSENCTDVTIMFSGGRDSIVMLDLFKKFAWKTVKNIVFLYFCPGMSFDEKILRYYEKRYDIEIKRIFNGEMNPFSGSKDVRGNQKTFTMGDMEKLIRTDCGSRYLAYGYKKEDSIFRRGRLANLDFGIDYYAGKTFPVAEWSKKHLNAWIKKEKLLLPSEYKCGYTNINNFTGEIVEYIYNNYPEDYEKLKAFYPDVEGELIRWQSLTNLKRLKHV